MNGIADHFLLYVVVPQRHGRGKLARRLPLPILPTHEVIVQMFRDCQHKFMAHVAAPDLLCDNFYSHDTVLAHGAGKCFPLRLFMDWARPDNRQAVLNISISSLFLPTRAPFGSYHKRIFCKCGCRGAHTLQPILDAVAWVFRVLATGLWPETDYYGNPWHSWRRSMAGAQLFGGFRGVLCEVSGDLDEWAKSCGLPDYRANFGCVKCFKRKRDLKDHGARCKRRTHEWLVATATTSLTLQPLTEELADVLNSSCVASKKAGVVIKRNLGPDLKPGDRLEPACAGTIDFWHGESFQHAPLSQRQALIYRRPENSLLFISRLFHIPGIQAGIPGLQYDHFLLDSQHCLEIGVVPYSEGLTLQHLISKGFFGHPNEPDAVEVAVIDSGACYWQRNAVCQEQPQIDLKGIVSGKGSPCLKAKAHEAKALLGWIVDLLRRRGAALFLDGANGDLGQALLACGSGLLEFYNVCAREPRKMSDGALEHLGILSRKIVQEWDRAGGHSTMKWHILAHHLVSQMSWAGNCTWSHNYADETENFYVRCRGASVHRQRFFCKVVSRLSAPTAFLVSVAPRPPWAHRGDGLAPVPEGRGWCLACFSGDLENDGTGVQSCIERCIGSSGFRGGNGFRMRSEHCA